MKTKNIATRSVLTGPASLPSSWIAQQAHSAQSEDSCAVSCSAPPAPRSRSINKINRSGRPQGDIVPAGRHPRGAFAFIARLFSITYNSAGLAAVLPF
jgi:hypothetical protein